MSHIYHPGRRSEPAEFQMAKTAFEKAIELDSTFARSFVGLAYCLRLCVMYGLSKSSEKDLGLALNAAKRAVELDPDDSFARSNVGVILHYLGRSAEGLAELRASVESGPTDQRALLLLGHVLYLSGSAEEAVIQLERARVLSSNSPVSGAVDANLAMALVQLSHFDEALETAQRAMRSPSTDIFGNCALIAALGHLGRVTEAKTAIDEIRARRLDFSISFVRKTFPFSDATLFEIYADGLRKAGLPDN